MKRKEWMAVGGKTVGEEEEEEEESGLGRGRRMRRS